MDSGKVEVKTPKEFFEEVLPTRFNSDKAVDFEAVAQVNLTGSNGGHWTITVKDQKIEIVEGDAPSPAIILKMKDTDFIDMVNGKLSAVNAFMTGKLEFNGSMATGLKLFDMGFV
jgi:putative sterol carrier protein